MKLEKVAGQILFTRHIELKTVFRIFLLAHYTDNADCSKIGLNIISILLMCSIK